MKQRLRLIFMALLLSYLLLFAGSLVYTLITSLELSIIPEFRLSWTINRTLVSFLSLLPSAQFTMLIFLYSFYIPKKQMPRLSITYPQLISSINKALLFFLLFTGVYVFSYELFLPSSRIQLKTAREISSMILSLDERIETAEKNEELDKQLRLLNIKRSLLPENEALTDRIITIQNKVYQERNQKEIEQETSEQGQTFSRTSGTKDSRYYTEKAHAFLQGGELSSGIYYANLALTLDPENSQAREYLQEAWKRLENPSSPKKPTPFDQKKHALAVLEGGNPIKAYYLFLSLSRRYPKDSDIDKYLAKSRKQLLSQAFFYEEVKNLNTFSRFNSDLLFVMKDPRENQLFFHWDKLVNINGTLYIQNIEALGFAPDQTFLYYLKAPYGKVVQGKLLTTCLSKEEEDRRREPSFLTGSPKLYPQPLPLPPEILKIPSSGFSSTDLKNLTLGNLFSLRPIIAGLGYPKQAFESEIIERLLRIICFFSFSFLSIAFGWRTRISVDPYAPGWGYCLFLAPLLLFVHLGYEFYIQLNLLLSGYLLLAQGPLVSRGILIAIQSLIIVLTLVYYVKQFDLSRKAA